MPHSGDKATGFDKFKETVRWWAVLLACLGLGGIFWSAYLGSAHGFWQDVVQALGMTLLTVAIVDVLLEGFARRDLSNEFLLAVEKQSREILTAVRLSASVSEAHLTEITRNRLVDWDDFLDGASEVTIVPSSVLSPDPEWNAALAVAKTRKFHVHLHIPDAKGAIPAYAVRENTTVPAAEERTKSFETRFRDEWRESHAVSGSVLKVNTFKGVPGFGLVAVDEKCAVVIPPAGGTIPASRPIVLTFSRSEEVEAWLADQISSIESSEFDVRIAP